MKKGALKNLALFTGNLQTCNFIKKRLQCRYFPLNIEKFCETPIFEENLVTAASDFLEQLQNTAEPLLLY